MRHEKSCGAVVFSQFDGAWHVLLIRHEHGRHISFPKGHVEAGESERQTAEREILEETGVRVHTHTARYLASQPWPFPGSLMLGFIAHAEPDAPHASEELEDARWFSADEVRAGLARDWRDADGEGDGIVLSSPISIARHVMHAWLQQQDAVAG